MDDFKARLSGPAFHMPGVNLAVDDAIAQVTKAYPGRSYCVVSEWVWLDLDAPDLLLQGMQDQGQQPVMLLAFKVLHDSLDDDTAESWIRSQPLVELVNSKFFVTKNTVYVLIGDGERRRMSLSLVLRIF